MIAAFFKCWANSSSRIPYVRLGLQFKVLWQSRPWPKLRLDAVIANYEGNGLSPLGPAFDRTGFRSSASISGFFRFSIWWGLKIHALLFTAAASIKRRLLSTGGENRRGQP